MALFDMVTIVKDKNVVEFNPGISQHPGYL